MKNSPRHSASGNSNSYHPPLNRQEQIELHNKMRDGDSDATNTIVSSCLPLVISIAKKFRYNNKHVDIEDMIQEGNIALIKAVENWDVQKGSITTVATWYIRNRLVDVINDAKYNIQYPYSLSRRAAEELRKVKNINSTDIEHISNETGLSPKRVKKLLSITPRGTKRVSLSCEDVKKSTDHTDELETPTKPCVGDLIDLINNNLDGDQKTIFCLWAGIYKKKIGPKEIAKSIDKTEKYVYDNIYSAKRILSRIAKKARTNA
ncbi:MAG TPA: hypothetical protein DCS66_08090 [Flavobacteriaceae bacterium]|nr:hypothetical protein [Flavobacteriaceae bacterium]